MSVEINQNDEIELRSLNDWYEFADSNSDALLEIYPNLDAAQIACRQKGIALGGGAAPLVRVFFVD